MQINVSLEEIVSLEGEADIDIICYECGDELDSIEGKRDDVFRIIPCKKCLDKRYFEGRKEGIKS